MTLRIDATEPQAHRPGRCAFVPGKKKQNTYQTTTISNSQGRTLWSGAARPGRMHDQKAVRTEGIAEQLRLHPKVKAEGYRGLANAFPDQVSGPPKKPKDDALLGEQHTWREQRRHQFSRRICVEHANAEHKQWRPLQRFLGRRELSPATHRAVAGLVSDRAAQRATHPRPSTELVPVNLQPADSPTSRNLRPARPNINSRPRRKSSWESPKRARTTRALQSRRVR
ncbi:transposase family protein [Streptomyces sp. NPDC001339]|uniref:transposase family protein n=1 Tax=Streptomyces sp. NPDC001339 TaxID=3364563 RepID=UPI00369FCF34